MSNYEYSVSSGSGGIVEALCGHEDTWADIREAISVANELRRIAPGCGESPEGFHIVRRTVGRWDPVDPELVRDIVREVLDERSGPKVVA